MGRFSLTEDDLIGMLVSSSPAMKKVYREGGGGAQPSPLQHAATLLHTEILLLGHDYLSSIRVAWEALRAVQGVFGGPSEGKVGGVRGKRRRGGGRGTGDQEQEMVDAAEVLVGRVFEVVANEDRMRAVGKAFAGALSAKFLGGE
jgi:hypothetical protein